MSRSAASNCPDADTIGGLDHPSPLAAISIELFESLSALHGLPERDGSLLGLAADLYECSASAGAGWEPREVVLRATLATLPGRDAFVIEAVADLSRHTLGHDAGPAWTRAARDERRRILWLTGLLRMAHAASSAFGWNIEGVYASWTDMLLHLELDGALVHEEGLHEVLGRCAALEVAAGRRVVLTSSHQRRCGVA